jgi:hypothetical protein
MLDLRNLPTTLESLVRVALLLPISKHNPQQAKCKEIGKHTKKKIRKGLHKICRTLAALRQSSIGFGAFVLCKGSRHLVLWSLGNLTGLSEILRQGTGCVKGRC